jgi:exosome complex component MTR3
MMSILSGCVTVASAAITDAGIDCVDLVTGGVAAIVRQPAAPAQFVLDPCPSDHEEIIAACVVGYLQSRDEITETWAKGDIMATSDGNGTTSMGFEMLVDQAVEAAMAARRVLVEAVKEGTEAKIQSSQVKLPEKSAST